MSDSNSIPKLPPKAKDLTGQRFGRLTALSFAGRFKGANAKQLTSAWGCLCECGNVKTIYYPNLKAGKAQSCGCLQREQASERSVKHGMTGSPEWESWRAMWDRCTNPNDLAYPRYKDKCPPAEWRDFSVFYADMGPKPEPGLTLDRVDNSKPYGPGNCRWATWHTQTRNRSVNVWVNCQGTRKVLADAANLLGISSGMARKVCAPWKDT